MKNDQFEKLDDFLGNQIEKSRTNLLPSLLKAQELFGYISVFITNRLNFLQKIALEMALNFFTKHDYHLIGMDHFADKQDELYTALQNKSIHRNFMGYTTRADAHQIGFGVSSISYVNGNYFQNFKKLPEYEQSIKSESLATYRGFILNQDDKIRRDLITELMCQQEIKIPEFEEVSVNLYGFKKFSPDEILIGCDSL